MENPFVVKVPQGATEVDLSPVLKPLLWALKDKLSVGSGRSHSWGSRRPTEDFSVEEMGDLFVLAQNSYRYHQLIRRLTKSTLVSYLIDEDWVDEDGRGHSFIRKWDVGRSLFDRTGGMLHLRGNGSGKTLDTHVAKEIVSKLAHASAKSKLEMIEIILARDNVLDRIVTELY